MNRLRTLRDRQRPAYLWMLAGIIALYTVIIGFGSSTVGGVVRVALLGYLIWFAARLRSGPLPRRLALAVGAVAVVAILLAAIFGSIPLIYAVEGASSVVLIAMAIFNIAFTLRGRLVVDITTVLGVLCIYLLFALFFSGLHQLLGAYIAHYLNGTVDPATPSDLLYFSVVTLTTVGFGDITPVAEVARAVTVVEALLGQLYLVSVVAGAVGGSRRRRGDEARS